MCHDDDDDDDDDGDGDGDDEEEEDDDADASEQVPRTHHGFPVCFSCGLVRSRK